MNRMVIGPALFLACLAGCDTGYVRTQKSDSGSGTTVSAEIDQEKIRRDKEAFRQRTEAKLREWDAKLKEMEARAEQATGQAKVDLEREIEAQKPRLEEARRKLHEVDAVVGEKWAEFEARSAKAWNDISDGFEKAFSRFK